MYKQAQTCILLTMIPPLHDGRCDDRINPIFELAKKHNTRVDDVWGGYSSCWGERCEFYKDGKKISRKSVQRAFEVASPLSLCSHADAAMQVCLVVGWIHPSTDPRPPTTALVRPNYLAVPRV